MPRRSPEKTAQAQIKRALSRMGFQVSDLSQPRASMQTPGLPDLYAQHPTWEMRVWVEAKAPGTGRVSPAQSAWHRLERAAGGTVIVATCAADLIEPLRQMGAPIAA